MGSQKKHSGPPQTIAELVSVAVTLLCLPGGLLYAGLVVAISQRWLDASNNLMFLMTLALSGFGLFVLALVGIVATIMHGWQRRSFRGLPTLSLFVQGGILLAMMILWGSGWQIQ